MRKYFVESVKLVVKVGGRERDKLVSWKSLELRREDLEKVGVHLSEGGEREKKGR